MAGINPFQTSLLPFPAGKQAEFSLMLVHRQGLKCGLAVAEVVKTFVIFSLYSKLLTSSATPK